MTRSELADIRCAAERGRDPALVLFFLVDAREALPVVAERAAADLVRDARTGSCILFWKYAMRWIARIDVVVSMGLREMSGLAFTPHN
eukprot:1776787-Pleurochrysis_carterae.AAC.1